jgi:2-polyprenyl-3-methyl-5-hydroxy-6-metoxy-1,4-benzoquinol methylase
MDIVERLREFESVKDYWGDWEIAKEAADEIERLREELDRQIAWKNYAIVSGIILADAALH